MQVPLLDLKAQYKPLKQEIMTAIEEICDSQGLILGKRAEDFEKHIAEYCNCKYSLGVSSGSDALIIALMVEGIGAGDEVITTPFTFIATVGAISRVGATPVFVDINENDFNINPDLIEAKITKKTKAIMPVHLYGQMAAMDKIMAIAKKHSLIVIEDAAQAIGSEYQGRRAGSIGDYGCFSCYPSKNLAAFGDAGVVTTNSQEKYELLKIFRNHGSSPSNKYLYKYVGGNFRLDALQAAVLDIKLKYLDSWSKARQNNADDYRKLFAASKIGDKIVLPVNVKDATRHIYNQFCVLFKNGQRDVVKAGLVKAEVGTDIYYPLPLHLQESFEHLGGKRGDFPVSERIGEQILALPIYPESTHEQRAYVVSAIEKILLG